MQALLIKLPRVYLRLAPVGVQHQFGIEVTGKDAFHPPEETRKMPPLWLFVILHDQSVTPAEVFFWMDVFITRRFRRLNTRYMTSRFARSAD